MIVGAEPLTSRASPPTVTAPQACRTARPTMTRAVTGSVQSVERTLRNLIHSEATTRPKVTPAVGLRRAGAVARAGPGLFRVRAVIAVHLRSGAPGRSWVSGR